MNKIRTDKSLIERLEFIAERIKRGTYGGKGKKLN
jgi:hypothetical protein